MLSGLLHALVHDDTESSTGTAIDGTDIDESTTYTERTASNRCDHPAFTG
jgi:hypothetical protein